MAIFSLTLRRRAAAAEIRGNFGISADSAVTVADKTGYPQTIFLEARMELLSRSTNPFLWRIFGMPAKESGGGRWNWRSWQRGEIMDEKSIVRPILKIVHRRFLFPAVERRLRRMNANAAGIASTRVSPSEWRRSARVAVRSL